MIGTWSKFRFYRKHNLARLPFLFSTLVYKTFGDGKKENDLERERERKKDIKTEKEKEKRKTEREKKKKRSELDNRDCE